MARWFSTVAARVAAITGSYLAFLTAFALILIWAASGPIFNFSTTWQLVVNTATTIVTFLMVFLIQNTQNRDSLAMHLKLDELIHSIDTASDSIIDAEDQTDDELSRLKSEYAALHTEHARLQREHAELRGDRTALSNQQSTGS